MSDLWEKSVGWLPHKVTVYEREDRGGELYLRWRSSGNWKRKSLRRSLRTARGRIDADVQKWALDQASAQYAKLVAGLPDQERAASALPLTLGETERRIIDLHTGKYPADTPHRREVQRALKEAVSVWGASTPWAEIRKADMRKLWRGRITTLLADGETGARGAEITASRVFAVAQWLRDEEIIPPQSCVPWKKWKQELKDDWSKLSGNVGAPPVARPRYTLEESRKLLKASKEADPRFALLLAVGAELRLGQVARCRRTDLDLTHRTLTVHASGHKGGAVVKLTKGQFAAVKRALSGYLRELEKHCADYPLFPSGQMPGGRSGRAVATVDRHATAQPIERTAIRLWMRALEVVADVPHVSGRGAYGIRRAAVDAAKAMKISREGLKAHGGWSDTQMPDRIYAEQQMEYAQEEARDIRAKIRGERGPNP